MSMAEQSETQTSAMMVEAIPELLEAIILHTPPRDMLVTARVPHRWKSLIEESPLIRKRLCLGVQTAEVISPSSTRYKDLKSIYKGCLEGCFVLGQVAVNRDHDDGCLTMKEDWARRGRYGHCERECGECECKEPVTDSATVITHRGADLTGYQHAWHRPEASWRELFWTSPPCSEATVVVRDFRLARIGLRVNNEVRFSIRDKSGIRLGLIDEYVQGVISDLRDAFNPDDSGDFRWSAAAGALWTSDLTSFRDVCLTHDSVKDVLMDCRN